MEVLTERTSLHSVWNAKIAHPSRSSINSLEYNFSDIEIILTGYKNLVHPLDELVDVVLTVPGITTLNIVVPLLLQATKRCLQLEWPEEVVGLLEVWANSHDLMDKILNADDVVLPKALMNSK